MPKARAHQAGCGVTFGFTWKMLSGSQVALRAARRASFASPYSRRVSSGPASLFPWDGHRARIGRRKNVRAVQKNRYALEVFKIILARDQRPWCTQRGVQNPMTNHSLFGPDLRPGMRSILAMAVLEVGRALRGRPS